MAKKELIPVKQEKAHERIKNFRGELADYRQTLEHLKRDREDSVSSLMDSPDGFTTRDLCLNADILMPCSKLHKTAPSSLVADHIILQLPRTHTPNLASRRILHLLLQNLKIFRLALPRKTTHGKRTLYGNRILCPRRTRH